MNTQQLTYQQKQLAIHRLTALWAFAESGLGGVMHALKIPFTGLLVGGIAVMLITLIARFAEGNYKQVLQSLIIVLLVKAAVSPHTPFPAYIAVSFQAVTGFILFSWLRVNGLSIFLLSILAMIESAIQKLLVLTFFFGQSIWKAADELVNYVAKQFATTTAQGSVWLMSAYIGVYIVGGVVIAFITMSLLDKLQINKEWKFSLAQQETLLPQRHKSKNRLVGLLAMLIVISGVLYLFSTNTSEAWLATARSFAWTVTAILLWYVVISPIMTRLFLSFLHKRKHVYGDAVEDVMLLLPVLHQLTRLAWQESAKQQAGWRIANFLSLLISMALAYTEDETNASAA